MEITKIKELLNEFGKDMLQSLLENYGLKVVYYSYKKGYIDDSLDLNEIGSHNDYIYNPKYYCITIEKKIEDIEDCNLCTYYEQYCTTGENVYTGRYEEWFSQKALDCKIIFWEYRNNYYTSDGLEYHNLIVMDDGEVEHLDNVYYWESDGEYHYEPEPREEYISEYNSNDNQAYLFGTVSDWFIGIEAEKEDLEIKECCYVSDLPDYWSKERDGSLDNKSGFEFISPTMYLNSQEITEYIKNDSLLLKHINADYSKSCGGHIHLSNKYLTGEELFNKIKGYTPLFYALYYGRVGKNYSKGKSNENLLSENEKYQAIRIFNNRIEYRIFSAIPNIQTLNWRLRLLELITQNLESDITKAFTNVITNISFINLISEQYKGEKYEQFVNRYINYIKDFENISLNIKDFKIKK